MTTTLGVKKIFTKAWANGKVSGLCARGGFVVDMEWENGQLSYAEIRSRNGGECRIHTNFTMRIISSGNIEVTYCEDTEVHVVETQAGDIISIEKKIMSSQRTFDAISRDKKQKKNFLQ